MKTPCQPVNAEPPELGIHPPDRTIKCIRVSLILLLVFGGWFCHAGLTTSTPSPHHTPRHTSAIHRVHHAGLTASTPSPHHTPGHTSAIHQAQRDFDLSARVGLWALGVIIILGLAIPNFITLEVAGRQLHRWIKDGHSLAKQTGLGSQKDKAQIQAQYVKAMLNGSMTNFGLANSTARTSKSALPTLLTTILGLVGQRWLHPKIPSPDMSVLVVWGILLGPVVLSIVISLYTQQIVRNLLILDVAEQIQRVLLFTEQHTAPAEPAKSPRCYTIHIISKIWSWLMCNVYKRCPAFRVWQARRAAFARIEVTYWCQNRPISKTFRGCRLWGEGGYPDNTRRRWHAAFTVRKKYVIWTENTITSKGVRDDVWWVGKLDDAPHDIPPEIIKAVKIVNLKLDL